ncbi:uncharacterized protein B0H64DRAFT_359119 [Chaetomium fimeti]|uniref:Uncharacterized protein n=1 Tax=Chaetomium fimeti TaxID=1854472 RepID=A0AAE0HFI2_9PEZI|nr:hypothetical protein B0H64DRAFT_359119 [Chaetomium fimeti]
MPRPKRSRVPATRPTKAVSPVREGPQSSGTPPIVTKPIAAQPEVPGSDIYDVSDREKERTKQRLAGAATAGSQTRRTRASQHLDVNSDQARVLEDSRRKRDDAMNRLDDLTSTSRPDEAENLGTGHSGQAPAASMQPRLTDVSGLDLDDDLFANLDDTLDDTEEVIEATQTGYRSADTSSFNVAMFKRRPRQSSVAGRDTAPIRPSSRGQNTPSISHTLNFGNFRRRAREPSILGTGRKARTARSLSRASQASRNASVLGDGDDSAPPQKKVTTADLTSLLPRRRHKTSNRDNDRNDPFDLDASEDERYNAAGNGADESSDVDSRATRRRKGQRPLAKSTSNGKGKQAEAGNAASKRRAVRTYGSMNENKENNEAAEEEIVVASGDEELDEEDEAELPVAETSQMMVERVGEELQKAAKKFKEVDKWELSFEQATQSSSPGPFAR